MKFNAANKQPRSRLVPLRSSAGASPSLYFCDRPRCYAILSSLEGLFIGCIEADVCKEILTLKHLPRPKDLCTEPLELTGRLRLVPLDHRQAPVCLFFAMLSISLTNASPLPVLAVARWNSRKHQHSFAERVTN